jgi:TPM domain
MTWRIFTLTPLTHKHPSNDGCAAVTLSGTPPSAADLEQSNSGAETKTMKITWKVPVAYGILILNVTSTPIEALHIPLICKGCRSSAFWRKAPTEHAVASRQVLLRAFGSSRNDVESPSSTRVAFLRDAGLSVLSSLGVAWMNPSAAQARLESVNRPDLLPSEKGLNVIQTEKFLTSGQAKRMNDLLSALERDTGYRVRVLCQKYPLTPGLAIRDYWSLGQDNQKDDKYVVLVVDEFGGNSNMLNFNVGDGVKLALPNIFWTRLSNKFGTVSDHPGRFCIPRTPPLLSRTFPCF